MGDNTIDFNRIFFGRHEGYHKIITLAVLLAVIIVIGGYQFFGTQPQPNDNRNVEPTKTSVTTLDYKDLLAKNPKLSFYTKSANCTERFGFVYSSPKATKTNTSRLNILTLGGNVVGIAAIWPASYGWFSYTNQPKGKPITIGGIQSYVQTIYFADPPSAADCAAAGTSDIYKMAGTSLKYENILARNPKLSAYTKFPTCMENFGVGYFPAEARRGGKPRLSMLTFNGEVIGVVMTWPASDGWFSYADQTEKTPLNISGVPFYTQAIHFKDPPTKEDCAKAID